MTARENCRQWKKRTDSVEQIALDMLNYCNECAKHGIIEADEERDFSFEISEFAERLRSQGIEVPDAL